MTDVTAPVAAPAPSLDRKIADVLLLAGVKAEDVIGFSHEPDALKAWAEGLGAVCTFTGVKRPVGEASSGSVYEGVLAIEFPGGSKLTGLVAGPTLYSLQPQSLEVSTPVDVVTEAVGAQCNWPGCSATSVTAVRFSGGVVGQNYYCAEHTEDAVGAGGRVVESKKTEATSVDAERSAMISRFAADLAAEINREVRDEDMGRIVASHTQGGVVMFGGDLRGTLSGTVKLQGTVYSHRAFHDDTVLLDFEVNGRQFNGITIHRVAYTPRLAQDILRQVRVRASTSVESHGASDVDASILEDLKARGMGDVVAEVRATMLDESIKPDVDGWLGQLASYLTQYDMKQSMKPGFNHYALGHYLGGVQDMRKTMGAGALHLDDAATLKRLRVVTDASFELDFPPVKKWLKQLDAYVATGKVPNYGESKNEGVAIGHERAVAIVNWMMTSRRDLPFEITAQFGVSEHTAYAIYDLKPQAFGPGGRGFEWYVGRVERLAESNVDEAVYSLGGGTMRRLTWGDIHLVKDSVYYLGASSSPSKIIVTSATDGDEFFTYRQYPFKADIRGSRRYLDDLIVQGTNTWLATYGRYPANAPLVATLRANLAGKPGPENGRRPASDYQPCLVLVAPAEPVAGKPSRDAGTDPWYWAEEYGGVGGIGDNYEIMTDHARLRALRADRRFKVISVKDESKTEAMETCPECGGSRDIRLSTWPEGPAGVCSNAFHGGRESGYWSGPQGTRPTESRRDERFFGFRKIGRAYKLARSDKAEDHAKAVAALRELHWKDDTIKAKLADKAGLVTAKINAAFKAAGPRVDAKTEAQGNGPFPCPTCGRANMLSADDVKRRYQCYICTSAEEFGMESLKTETQMTPQINDTERRRANAAINAAGCDGNGRFVSASAGANAAMHACSLAIGLEPDEAISADRFRGDQGHTVIHMAWTNRADSFSPVAIENSWLFVSWTKLNAGGGATVNGADYEVVAYMS